MLIPLRQFINSYLKKLKIKNIFTNKFENCQKIFSWKGSGALDILVGQGYMIETKYNYVTDEQEFGLVKVDVKDKVIKEIKEDVIVPITKWKYRIVDSDQIKGYRITYKPIYKRVKIGRRYEYTTQYKKIKKPIYKKQREYYQVTDYEYKTITHQIVEKQQIFKKITFKEYIPFMLFEKYRYDSAKGDIEHTLTIKPFYSQFGEVVSISAENSLGMREFTTPEDFSLSQQYKDFLPICRQLLFGSTTQKESMEFFKNFVRRKKKEKRYKSSYSYSEDIIDTVFFRSADFTDNKQVKELTEEQLKEEII